MHQETLCVCGIALRRQAAAAGLSPGHAWPAPDAAWIDVPAGEVTLGASIGEEPFTWDNERRRPRACPSFAIERHNVTNGRSLPFVEAGGYDDRRWWTADWAWRTASRIDHPPFWIRRRAVVVARHARPRAAALPVAGLSAAEASAFARWRRGCRAKRSSIGRPCLPAATSAGIPGSTPPTARHAVLDFASWDPQPAGRRPDGDSAWGIADLVGNGWEWTSSVFAPFAGFEPLPSYPEYSADFFDGEHVVMKGASPVTAAALVRPSFRNWFRPRYPYVYAGFRCVRERGAR
jgi:formylglycine-generating enzyme required for sulfatase activity